MERIHAAIFRMGEETRLPLSRTFLVASSKVLKGHTGTPEFAISLEDLDNLFDPCLRVLRKFGKN